MTAISFKDVGVKQQSIEADVLRKNKSSVPIGIKTPLEFDSKTFLKMHYNVGDQIKDNLKNLLLTNHGERVNQYFFGANLWPLSAEYNNKDDFDSEAMLRINTAITRFMPFVSPIEYESKVDRRNNQHVGRVRIRIAYSVPALSVKRDELELEITVI